LRAKLAALNVFAQHMRSSAGLALNTGPTLREALAGFYDETLNM
jgi:hypothetical protein